MKMGRSLEELESFIFSTSKFIIIMFTFKIASQDKEELRTLKKKQNKHLILEKTDLIIILTRNGFYV
jgi:hypothetical protein